MKGFLEAVNRTKNLFFAITEAGFVLVGFMVLVYLLLGEQSGEFVLSVMTNLTLLIGALTPEALVALAIALAIGYLMRRRA